MVNATTPELETERLLLRQWKDSDLEPFARMNEDPVVMEHFPTLLTHEETAGMVQRIKNNFEKCGWGLFAVELKESGEFIGYVGLSPANLENHMPPCTEVGWRLSREYWGKGYAPEAARRVLKFGFEVLKLDEICSWTATINKNSIRVMEKIGLRRDQDSDFDHPRIPEGHRLRRHVFYRMKASEFHSSV